jgi:hypothetical protein
LPVVEYLPLTDPVARQIYMNLMKNKWNIHPKIVLGRNKL